MMKGEKIKKYYYEDMDGKKVVAGYGDYVPIRSEILKKCCPRTLYLYLSLIKGSNRKEKYELIDQDYNFIDFVASAECDEYDDYDYRVGKSIAGAKVDAKYHEAMARRYKNILNKLHDSINELEKLAIDHSVKASNCRNSIDKYLKGDDNE